MGDICRVDLRKIYQISNFKREIYGLVEVELFWYILRFYKDLREGYWNLYDK